MPDSEREDSITTLNTALNKSMILMDSPTEPKNRTKADSLDSSSILHTESDPPTGKEELTYNHLPRPHNLDDFLKEDSFMTNPTNSTFSLADLSDSEEMWVIDIPKTVDPRKLKGQTLSLGKKSKLKMGDERYCAVNRNNAGSLTWVFNTGRETKPYKAVNVTPTAAVTIRRKLPNTSKQVTDFSDTNAVPFPSNLKIRHPFFGPSEEIGDSLCIKMASK
ncbi:uncharacterized protein [Venturia canescens]|uniref:uncharacterized protein isoform X2 n=1 Tax=Venturia canescens TaxID=32260 RepID=UPI001C9BDD6B|nr:uncharacterized protein LOC122405625 isoform X2 [Venturia canescens]